MIKLKNLTPHTVVLSVTEQHEITVPPDGFVARVNVGDRAPVLPGPLGVPGVAHLPLRGLELPLQEDGVILLVSLPCLDEARKQGRSDVAAPDTGPGSAVRDESGQIVAVTRLIWACPEPSGWVAYGGAVDRYDEDLHDVDILYTGQAEEAARDWAAKTYPGVPVDCHRVALRCPLAAESPSSRRWVGEYPALDKRAGCVYENYTPWLGQIEWRPRVLRGLAALLRGAEDLAEDGCGQYALDLGASPSGLNAYAGSGLSAVRSAVLHARRRGLTSPALDAWDFAGDLTDEEVRCVLTAQSLQPGTLTPRLRGDAYGGPAGAAGVVYSYSTETQRWSTAYGSDIGGHEEMAARVREWLELALITGL